MSQIEFCFKGPNDKRPHSVAAMEASNLSKLAHALRPYVVPMFSASHLRDLIPELHQFADDTAGAETLQVEFKLREVLELYSVVIESSSNINRRLSFELRTMLGDKLLGEDICASVECNTEFGLGRLHATLQRACYRTIRERGSLIVRRANT